MNVNTKSWHYRFNVWRTNTSTTKRKNTLCSYFWFTVFNMTFISFISGIFISLIYMIGYRFHEELVKHGWDFISMPFYVSIPAIFFSGAIILAIFVLLALFLLFVGCGAVHVFNKIKTTYSEKHSKKEQGLVMSYIKAKKSKICPIIEFKD